MTLVIALIVGLIVGFRIGMRPKWFVIVAAAFLIVQAAQTTLFVSAGDPGVFTYWPVLVGFILLFFMWIGAKIRSHRSAAEIHRQ